MELHSNVTDKMKERKQKSSRKGKAGQHDRCKQNSGDDMLPSDKQPREKQSTQNTYSRISSARQDSWKKEKRDSGIIRDSFTDSDF